MKEKKKVGLLIPLLSKGGAGRAVSRISKLLISKYDLYIVLYEASNIEYEFEGTLVDLHVGSEEELSIKKVFRQFKRLFAVKQIKKKLKLDVMISFLDIANICNIITKTDKCKVIVSVRGSIRLNRESTKLEYFKKKILKRIYKKADSIISVSKQIEALLINEIHIPPTKVSVIYNPISFEEVYRKIDKLVFDEFIKFIKNKKVLTSAGELIYIKGQYNIIKALYRVLKDEDDVVLVIMGDGPLKEQLMQLVDDLDLESSVFFTGYYENVFSIFKHSDLYILSSISEGFPNVLIEAMACGLPVIATDCESGPREILYDTPDFNMIIQDVTAADYGLVIPKVSENIDWNSRHIDKSQESLAKAISLLLSNKKLYDTYKNKSLERAKFFSSEKCKEGYFRTIEKVLS